MPLTINERITRGTLPRSILEALSTVTPHEQLCATIRLAVEHSEDMAECHATLDAIRHEHCLER